MMNFFENLRDQLDTLPPFVLKIVGVIVVLILTWFLGGLVRRWLKRALTRSALDVTLTKFFANFARTLILLIGVIICLQIFGVASTLFAALLGAAALAGGLALQGALSNFAAGVMLLIFRPYKVEDLVQLDGETGTVNAIDLFTTTLDTLDNRRIILPNGNVFGAKIENLTHHDIRRVDVAVGTDYSADLDQTRTVLEQAAASVSGRLAEPPAQIILLELGGSSINWEVRVWCNTADYWDVWDATTYAVKTHLDRAEIGIPFPQLDVHMMK